MSNETRGTKPGAGRGGSSDNSGGVQSVDRAIAILEILAREGSAGVSEVAAEIGVHKSTAFRLLGALEDRDLVEQNSERGKYQLAFGILRLASAIPGRLDMVQQAQPVIDELAARLDETINIAVLREHYAVNVQQALGSAALSTHNWVGQLTPLHATSSGKILLAYLSPEERDAVLQRSGLTAYLPATITSREALLAELAHVREQDYATACEELEAGLNASATSIRDHTGKVVGALSASGPAFRFDKTHIKAAEPQLKEAAAQISRRLGWLG